MSRESDALYQDLISEIDAIWSILDHIPSDSIVEELISMIRELLAIRMERRSDTREHSPIPLIIAELIAQIEMIVKRDIEQVSYKPEKSE